MISNGDYGLVISQAGSGYSFLTHASLNRITRWEQDLIRDEWGKYLYVRDLETGLIWSAGYQPAGRDLEDYRVRHGLGYTVLEGRRAGIAHSLTVFVPEHDPCELWILRLENKGSQRRRLQVVSYFEWLLGAAPDWHREFHKLFIETWYRADAGILLATKHLWELPAGDEIGWNRSWPYVAFHTASPAPSSFEGDKRAFLGRHGRLEAPQSLTAPQASNTQGRFGDAIGSLRVEVTLDPGESKEVVFVLGAGRNEEQALSLGRKYQDVTRAHEALRQVQRFWRELVGSLAVETPDEALNRMVPWLIYQAVSGRLFARTAYYQTGGAYGFRDQLQDSLIWLLLGRPERTLEQIKLHAAHQYREGIVLHWWHPLAETGSKSDYSDDLLWLPFALLYYLRETGDFAALEERVPYYDGGVGTLKEHALKAFEVALSRRSPRGLPLILGADWNDGLNAVGKKGRGESVWMAHFLYLLLTGWSELPVLDAATRERFQTEAQSLKAATNLHAWDGEWYWRATTDSGRVLGSRNSPEGKIFLNAQTWAVLSGLAPLERARTALASARKYLYQPFGPLLLAPAYTRPDPEIGYLTRYAPGLRENGGVYVHAACWAVLAERKVNGVGSAYELWKSFCPAHRGQDADAYQAEPYVMPGNVDGPLSPTPGRAGWTWYTGSAAWNLRAIVEGLLGLEATLEGLKLEAQLPEDWDGYRVTRRYRGTTYQIRVRRAEPGEARGLWVNGKPWNNPVLPQAIGEVLSVEALV
ncbi:glycosyl transferase family 36 [Thermus scotoductus]|uniref:Glycosyl transferase family 36 n=1 Tax=Thermus scotoductus TaxID=37636 RepID=A0A430SHZ5_THESC|nr:glycosyl transferase family 36 [Thermus scotoductus]